MSKHRWFWLGVFLWALPAGVCGQSEEASTTQAPAETARVVDVQTKQVEGQEQFVYTVRFLTGPAKGQTAVIGDDESVTNTGFKDFQVGDRVLVTSIDHISGVQRHLILDHARTSSLWWLFALFALAIIWFSRWRGLRSLVGLVFSFAVIIGWIVPQIASGANPVLVTIIGGTFILGVGFLLLEGWTKTALAAGAGTVVTMMATGLLSWWVIAFTHLTGEGSEETFFLQGIANGSIDVRGLLLAGIIIGTLGILDDLAISQVAAVAELRRANPATTPRQLYQAAMRIGRSHLAAIVNTLVLAYAGAALPLLVLFHLGQQETSAILNSELVATEVVRAVVGSIGLILALPITTAVAVWLKVESRHKAIGPSH